MDREDLDGYVKTKYGNCIHGRIQVTDRGMYTKKFFQLCEMFHNKNVGRYMIQRHDGPTHRGRCKDTS